MTKITFLGTSSAVPDKDHQNTHFIIESGERVILVDCVGNPVARLGQAEIDPLSITDLILTHFHPDHVSGVPLLLMDLWLLGRKRSLEVYGLQDVMDRIEKMMALFNWQDWDGFYPVKFHGLSGEELLPIINTPEVQLFTAPVCHMIPAIGFKILVPDGTLAYSTDTAPCDAVIRMAQGVDILIHEATGAGDGHSSAEQAGEIAQSAGAGTLYLIHYPPDSNLEDLVRQAKRAFSGSVIVAKDLMTISV